MSELLSYLTRTDDNFHNPARLTSLYSDFSTQRNSNPDGYAANVSAWRTALESGAYAGLVPGGYFTVAVGRDLEARLDDRRVGRPIALGSVVSEGVADKSMIPLQHFLSASASPLRKGWLPTVQIPSLTDVARWSLKAVGFQKDGGEGTVVLVGNLKRIADVLLQPAGSAANGVKENVFTLPAFTTHVSSLLQEQAPQGRKTELSPTDTQVLLRYLTRDINAATTHTTHSPLSSSETTIIKLCTRGATPSPISESDISLATLNSLLTSLQAQITNITTKITTLESQAKTLAVQSKTSTSAKAQALALLRSRSMLSASLAKRLDAASSVESTLLKLEEAVSNAEIVAALDMSAEVMKTINRKIGGVERVDRVMEDLKEAGEGVDEIAGVLGESAPVVDEGEVEDELAALVEEDRQKGREKEDQRGAREEEKVPELPSVPDRAPSTNPAEGAPATPSDAQEDTKKTEQDELLKKLGTLSIAES